MAVEIAAASMFRLLSKIQTRPRRWITLATRICLSSRSTRSCRGARSCSTEWTTSRGWSTSQRPPSTSSGKTLNSKSLRKTAQNSCSKTTRQRSKRRKNRAYSRTSRTSWSQRSLSSPSRASGRLSSIPQSSLLSPILASQQYTMWRSMLPRASPLKTKIWW